MGKFVLALLLAGMLAGCDIVAGGQLEGKVRKALAADPRTQSSDFEVSADGGVVTITGEITNMEEKAAVTEIAKAVPGVSDVFNNTQPAEEGSDLMQDTVVDMPYM